LNYQRIYDQFIADRLAKYPSNAPAKGRERHHIKPKGLGGTDDPLNIAQLLCSDHLFAHRLLARIHGGPMISAFFLMLNNKRYKGRCSRRLYERTRAEYLEVVGSLNRGKPQHPNLVAAIAAYNATRSLPEEVQAELKREKELPKLHASKLPRTAAQLAVLEKGRAGPMTPARLAALEKGRAELTLEQRVAALEKTWKRPRTPAQLAALAKGRAKGGPLGRAAAILAAEKRRLEKQSPS
jgi:hypothetical protein